jgi:hypothetical protein
MTDQQRSETLFGVGCDVVNCKYHGSDNCCHAQSIMVESPNALRKGETFCGTFAPRSS